MAGTSKGEGAHQEDAEFDARWAAIVEQLGDLETPPAADAAGDPAPAGPTTTGHVVARTPGPRDWPVTPEVEALEEEESHFAPPDPGSVLTSRDPLATLAWAGAVGVPLLGVVALILRAFLPALHVPSWTGWLAGALFAASVAVLIWRMPARRDPTDRDDGAVV